MRACMHTYILGQIIAPAAEVTPNGGLVREAAPDPLNSGLGIVVISPDTIVDAYMYHAFTIKF